MRDEEKFFRPSTRLSFSPFSPKNRTVKDPRDRKEDEKLTVPLLLQNRRFMRDAWRGTTNSHRYRKYQQKIRPPLDRFEIDIGNEMALYTYLSSVHFI